MNRYLDTIVKAYSDYAGYLYREITTLSWHNYFYWLIGISFLCFSLEYIFPWRKEQPRWRQDFWLDAFYMFFNFFLFSLIGYHAISSVFSLAFNDLLASVGIRNLVAIRIQSFPVWSQLLLLFILRDFIHWNVHRLLHRVPFLWEFHKVHHTVKQMGFAAHLRYHWMENVVYRTIEYIPLGMIGFGIQDFFFVHIIALGIGHLNHSNIYLPLGPLKYIFNNPQMHTLHHAKYLPDKYRYGVNFGISLSLWDYLSGKVYETEHPEQVELGIPDEENFPKKFWRQSLHGFGKKKIKTLKNYGT